MKNILVILGICVVVSGCASKAQEWHSSRLSELQAALDNNEISRSEYLDMKLRLDEMYIDGVARSRPTSGHIWVHNVNN